MAKQAKSAAAVIANPPMLLSLCNTVAMFLIEWIVQTWECSLFIQTATEVTGVN